MRYVNFGFKLTLISVLASHPAFAAKTIDLSKHIFLNTPANFTSDHQQAFDLRITHSHTDENQTTHTRFQQHYSTLPVWRGEGLVHVPSRNAYSHPRNFFSLLKQPQSQKNGTLFAEIEKDLGKEMPMQYTSKKHQNAAIFFIKTRINKRSPNLAWQFQNESIESIVYVDQRSKAHWAYKINLLATHSQVIPKQLITIIDAENFEVYEEWNNIKTIETVKVIGRGGNPLLGMWVYGKDKPALTLDRDEIQNRCFMQNAHTHVREKLDFNFSEMGNLYSFDCLRRDELKFAYEVPAQGYYGRQNEAYSPINDAFYYGQTIQAMYKNWYQMDVLIDASDRAAPLMMNLLSNLKFENAFWLSDTQQMYFGMGNDEFYPFVTLSIAAHEVSHGFTDQHSNLVYKDESGAINESFSDMVVPVISLFESQGKESEWALGWDILKSNSNKNPKEYQAVRYLDHPTKDNISIDHIKQLPNLINTCKTYAHGDEENYQSCFVHTASGIYNKVFYHLSHAENWNVRLAFKVMLKANQDYWTPHETFQSAACGVKKAAQALQPLNPSASLDAIDHAFSEVGISLEQC